MYLAHGKTQLNEEFSGIVQSSSKCYAGIGQDLCSDAKHTEKPIIKDSVIASDWMYGRKRGMLANFVVCTVDQVLMGALRMRHLALRHLALANKVVIIDECHAYDAYMQMYLNVVLEWLESWHVPVILMSATLPEAQRDEMTASYLKGFATRGPKGPKGVSRVKPRQSGAAATRNYPYPLLTYTDGLAVHTLGTEPSSRSTDVLVRLMGDAPDEAAAVLYELLQGGGCAGVVCDTVSRAQELADVLTSHFSSDEVMLTHARFTDLDRIANERRIRGLLGPRARVGRGRPRRFIVVGTQVLEQSLDIDFDVLVSDVVPIDLLLQRMGRLHRHARGTDESERPERLRAATCLVRGIGRWDGGVPCFSHAIEGVYERSALLEALAVTGLTSREASTHVGLPGDIPLLVQGAYGPNAALLMPREWSDVYGTAIRARDDRLERKRRRALAGLLPSVSRMNRDEASLAGWYGEKGLAEVGASDDDAGPRAVRDTQETIEVIALELRNGAAHLLPWIGDPSHGVAPGARMSSDMVPPPKVAKLAAQSTVRLPLAMCGQCHIDELIDALEKLGGDLVGAWQESPWLAGKLVLLMERREGESRDDRLTAKVYGWEVSYSKTRGLEAHSLARDYCPRQP